MSDNIAASMTASIVIDKNDLLAQILKGLSEGQKELENNKLELFFDFSNSKNKNEFEKIIQKYRKELSSEDLIIQIKNQGVEETIKSLDHLVEVIKSIASGKSFGAGLGNGIGDSIIDEKKLDSIIDLFTKMEAHLLSIKKVLSDVGEGEEFSPLFNVINKIDSSITQLSSKVSNIGLNMNIDFGSDKELEAKVEAKISNALQAYQRLFEHLKLSSVGGSYINNKFFDFDINQFDTPMSKLQAYRKFIENMRIEAKQMFNGQDILYTDTDKKYWNQASAAYGQVTRVFNEMNAASDVNPLENIFGKTDLSGVIEQLNTIVSKLDEISDSAKGFTETLKNGLNVNASVEEIEKLTNRVKELEDELAKIKTPTIVTTPQESDISSDISSQVKVSDNITDQIVANEKKKQEAYKATAETVIYHAGILSKLNKAETNGRFYGSNRGTGYFGTGHYFVDSSSKHYLDESSTYSKLPYSSIDISQYDNLFKANNDIIAKSLHEFLKNLTRYTQGDTKFNTNELFSQFENIFGNTVMDIKEFESRINGLKDFMSNSSLSDRSDSVSTQFMKSLGYGGVDTRGTKFADTEYGIVIYDLKEESVLQANITDELQKQGQMLKKINYEKGQVFDSSEDNRLQDIINQQEKGKAIREEYNKIYDDTKLDSYSTELSEINKKLDENDEIIGNCRLGIENAEKEAQQFAKEMKDLGIEMSNEEIQNSAIESKKSYQERIDELEKERPLLEARRQELEANLDAESKLSKAAMERATATVEDSMKDAFPKTSENIEQVAQSEQKVQQEAVATDKALDSISFTPNTEGFEDIIAKFGILREQAEQITKIVKTTKQTADGTDISYKATLKNGSSYYLGENSTPQVLNASETVYDARAVAKNAEQEAKEIQAEWGKNLKTIQDYMDAVTKLNNLKAKDKGTGREANQIALQTQNVEELKQAAWDARKNLSSMQAENPDIIAWKQWVDMMELFDQASKGSAESAAKLKDVLENIKPPSLDKYENKLFSFQTKTSSYDATIARFENGGWTSPEYLKNIQAVKDAVQKYETLLNKIKTEQNGIASETDIQTLKEYESEIKKTIATVTNMSAAQKGYSLVSGQKELDKIRQILKENSTMSAEAKGKIKAYYREIESGNPSMSLDKIHGEIMKIVNAEAEAGRAGKRMWDVIKEKAWYGAANVIGTYFGINDIFRYIQQGISTVREFDTALTEMRKVSDETVQSLKNYQSTTFDTADAVGTTAKQIQESTADYMRLGESLDEASESAKTANVLLNVSEFDNIEDATKSLVAMGQAYKDLDKMTIVDKLNEIGNNYAISTDELSTALQKSAATLSLMGNTIDEAASLVTTANATIQDADSVSAGLRTISLRLVGTEEAEEELSAMNEEVDAFVKATNSKKQQIIKDYTAVASNDYQGFDILDNNGNYKNTYEILLGIAKVYKEIQEQDKKLGTNHATALIEELAGKNRSNIASAILQDPTQLEAVKKSSEEAMGSAQKELNSYLDSIDGKMAQLENRAQEFWVKVINSDAIKNGIDLLSTLLKNVTGFVDKVGLLPTIFAGVGAALSFKNVGINTLVAY